MSKWKNIEQKPKHKSSSITFDEMTTLLLHYDYSVNNKGKTSGSRICFECEGRKPILLHKPHPQKDLHQYVIN